MKLDLFRTAYGDKSTSGKLSVDGIFECRTLELPYANGANQHDVNCVPEGVYPLVVNFSQHFQKDMIEVLNVPNRDGIRVHIANYPSELLGCIAVGVESGQDCLMGSTAAYLDLFPKVQAALKAGDAVTLEIHPIQADPLPPKTAQEG